MTTRRPWPQTLVESVLIVGSILLAFGIDAWWDDRNDALVEQRHLAALLAEFRQNEARSDFDSQYRNAVRILEVIDAGATEVDEEEWQRLLSGLLQRRTFHLESGAYDGLFASGEFNQIRDDRLRHELAAWPSYLADEHAGIRKSRFSARDRNLACNQAWRDIARPPCPDSRSDPEESRRKRVLISPATPHA